MLHCWSFEGFQTPSPVSCGPSAILHEPWATAKEVNWGVMNKVPNQNADPTVTALINLGGFNDLLATQQLAESGYKDPCNIQILDAPPQTLLKEVPINFNDLDPNWNSSRYWFQHVYIKIYKRNLTKRYKQQRFAGNIPNQIWNTGLYQIIFIPSSTSSTWHLDHPFRPQKHPWKTQPSARLRGSTSSWFVSGHQYGCISWTCMGCRKKTWQSSHRINCLCQASPCSQSSCFHWHPPRSKHHEVPSWWRTCQRPMATRSSPSCCCPSLAL